MPLAEISAAIDDYRSGKFVIIVDDEDRENEGDFAVAAEKVTPEHIAFMARQAGGLICMSIVASRLDELEIEPMVKHNTSRLGTAFSVSIEARDKVTTGISAHDRAATIRHVLDPLATSGDFSRPGHTFPLRAAEGGVLRRVGQTEASVDLARLAGLYPAGVICEIMNEDGTMARMPELEKLADRFGIRIIAIKDLIAYRRRTEKLVRRRMVSSIEARGRTWLAYAYEDLTSGSEDLALVLGKIDPAIPVLVRAHSRCLTGDVLGSQRCDCGPQLSAAMDLIAQDGIGVILYLGTHEGRGIGLFKKMHAYELQDQGLDTVQANEALDQPPDSRDYGIGAQIISDLGVRKMKLLTNNPRKLVGLEGHDLQLVARVPIRTSPTRHNREYLATKRAKLGHLL